MKYLSIKSRLVILHTISMTLVVILVLGILFSISSSEILANIENSLIDRVNESYEHIEYRDGMLTFDTGFIEIENGIYLSAYETGSTDLLYGRIPYGFIYDLAFEDGAVREIEAGEVTYYVYDTSVPIDGYGTIMVRGIVSITNATQEFYQTVRLAVIMLPVLVILTVACGYILSRRAMRPVAIITRTINEIRANKDLSKRIGLGEGKDEIYKLAATFDELLEDLENSMEREKRFTSDVAHELRTPITTVKMALDDIYRHRLSKAVREDVDIIKAKNEYMAKMVSDLLLLARADQGRLNITKEELDLTSLIKTLAQEFADIAKSIKLNIDVEDELKIMADEALMIRLLSNVLENATKFTKTKIDIRAHKTDEGIVIAISDDGIGIREEDKEKIFDRFSQVDTSRHNDGSGLGLAMVKWIAEVHGATITVDSALEKGSTFSFFFPIDNS